MRRREIAMKKTRLALAIFMMLSIILVGCEPGDKEGKGTPGPGGGDAWSYLDQADPDAPTLIEKDKGEAPFHLNPGWEVSSIEYVDQWWGLGEPGLNNQLVKREGTTYKRNGATVPDADVQALVKAIEHLYPAQMLMQGHSHTDDYPSWAVELTGTDGQHILLNASSTGNPGNGPWNVLNNGRLYAQYEGSIAGPLGKLFGGRLSSSLPGDESPFLGSGPAGEVNFSTTGLPPQLIYGFWGLLPISQDFSYIADPAKGEIKGQITGSSRIGSMEIGEIDKLENLQLTVGASQVSCKVELLPEGDPWTATTAWEFTCPVQGAKEGERYNYPIKGHFATSKGESLDVSGELWGKWIPQEKRGYTLLPPPPELKEAISYHPQAQDLMTDHIVGSTRYGATLSADKPLGGRRGGEAILYGQTQVDGKPVRYTVGAQFIVQDGKLTYWDLDRAALNDLLKAITSQPLTTRILAANSEAVLNLWYAKGTPEQVRTFMDSGPDAYAVSVNPCGAVPGGAFPGGEPLRAFAYNSSPYFYRPPFGLIDGKAVVSQLAFYSTQLEPDPVQKALLPDALDTGANKPFEVIDFETTPYSGGGPTLLLRIPQKAEASELAVYEERIKALPGTARTEQAARIIQGVTLTVNKEGKLEVASCSAAQAPPTSVPGGAGGEPPKLVYSTYYGSPNSGDRDSTGADALAIDSAGNAYITGRTSASNLPLKDPYDSSHSGGLWDAYIAKMDPNGSSLLYGTYLGSGDETIAEGITVDSEGNIYVTGSIYSGFPGTNSPIQSSVRGDADAFVAKLSTDGKKLLYATLLGGSDYDTGNSITTDQQGNAYVVGMTRSTDFHTERPIQSKYGGMGERSGDGFVAKINPDGSKLLYSTYLGGTKGDLAVDVKADDEGNAYVVGSTSSQDFPLSNPMQPKLLGESDAFLTKISPDGSRLIYSTLLGGSSGDSVEELALDGQGNVYVAGSTGSQDFPLKNPLYSNFNGGVLFSGGMEGVSDAFVAKVNPQGTSLIFSTLLGGSSGDAAIGVGLDANGNVYVGGSTTSNDFPLERPVQKEYAGIKFGMAPDSFITKLNPSGSALVYSTYFGGEGFDSLSDFAVNSNGDVYFAGTVDADSPGFPLTGKPFQSTNSGIRSAYIAKIAGETP
jgi:hypothetical protein